MQPTKQLMLDAEREPRSPVAAIIERRQKQWNRSKYVPHQSTRERERRLKQLARQTDAL